MSKNKIQNPRSGGATGIYVVGLFFLCLLIDVMLMRVFAGFCEAGDDDFDVVGVVDVFEVETFTFGGGLDVDVAKGEEGSEKAFCFAGDVLNLVEVDF